MAAPHLRLSSVMLGLEKETRLSKSFAALSSLAFLQTAGYRGYLIIHPDARFCPGQIPQESHKWPTSPR